MARPTREQLRRWAADYVRTWNEGDKAAWERNWRSVAPGGFSMYDRPGHIPTASNIPSSSLMAESGRFKTDAELDAMFTIDPDKRSITYCGGGIAATSDAFVLTMLGHDNVTVYDASMSEWANDPAMPMETG